MTNEEIHQQLTENTRMIREIHGVLVGKPEYKQPGLLDEIADLKATVKIHDHLITKVGGGVAVLVIGIEVLLKFI